MDVMDVVAVVLRHCRGFLYIVDGVVVDIVDLVSVDVVFVDVVDVCCGCSFCGCSRCSGCCIEALRRFSGC